MSALISGDVREGNEEDDMIDGWLSFSLSELFRDWYVMNVNSRGLEG